MTPDALRTTAAARRTDLNTRFNPPFGRAGPAGGQDLEGVRVLVMEDDFYLAVETARALQDAGAHVLGPCPNEEACREELERQAPTAAVVDINLGRGPSFQIARELKQRGVPFIFITGYDEQIIPAEFDGVVRLQKPVEHHHMIRKISETLAAAA